MNAPLVTIVIPVRNRPALACAAARSVIAQTCPDWELIVADDGSDDGTAEALEQIGEPRLRVLRCGRLGNVARLRNLGVRSGAGDYVAFLDSDDLWLPDKLARQLAAVRAGGAGWCYGGFGHIDADGAPIARRAGRFAAENGWILEALLLERTAAYVGTLLVERGLFDRVGGFDESLTARADVDLAFRLAAAAEAVAVPTPLMLVREHPARITAGFADPHELTVIVWEKFLAREGGAAFRSIARRRLARLLAGAAKRRLRARQPLRALSLLARAARHRLRSACAAAGDGTDAA